MKRYSIFAKIGLVGLFVLTFILCKKESPEDVPPETGKAIPTLTTLSFSFVSSTSFRSGGNISSDGGAPVTIRGFCWSTSQNPTIASNKTIDGSGTGSYVSLVSGLIPGLTYYAKAYASNSVGTGYGSQITVATSANAQLPSVTTKVVISITKSSAISGGNISASGSSAVNERGVCWSSSSNPTFANNKTSDGTGIGEFTSSLTSLTANTTYFVRAYATNNSGIVYGNQVSFTTSATVQLPTISTSSATSIMTSSATSGGNIASDGGGTISSRGVCWSTTQSPTITNSKTIDGNSTGSFTSFITGLSPNTLYYVRAYATNNVGTVYGSQISFVTKQASSVTVSDIDGNIYHTVLIGTQTWMVENLKVTKYRNGNIIRTSPTPFTTSDKPEQYQWAYNGIESNVLTYGRLYTWYAIRWSEICPVGWHVPTSSEWNTLINFLGPNGSYKIKEIGTSHWDAPNTGATNETGFTALPGGLRSLDGKYYSMGTYAYWWTNTEETGRFICYLLSGNTFIKGTHNPNVGMYIRCIKD
jgi:uncharacterized protein (TIGR02145 family)